VGEITALEVPGVESEEAPSAAAPEYLFERDPEGDYGFVLTQYLSILVYQVLLNAKASEQSARMVSMKNATDSAESLIKDLSLEYNKLRQGNITKELLEIAGGQSD
jgi:F-type H+-transporting ATPase subunit gamma